MQPRDSSPTPESAQHAPLRTFLQRVDEFESGKLLGGRNVDEYCRKVHEHAEVLSYTLHSAIAATIIFYCNDPGRDGAFVSMLAVSDSCRRRRVGSALLRSMIDMVKARGFRRIRLMVNQDNLGAIRLYEAIGFLRMDSTERQYAMEMQLAGRAE